MKTAIIGYSNYPWLYVVTPDNPLARSAKPSGGGIYHFLGADGRDGGLITAYPEYGGDDDVWHVDGHDGPIVWVGDDWRAHLPARGAAYPCVPCVPGVPVSHEERDEYERTVIATAMRDAAELLMASSA